MTKTPKKRKYVRRTPLIKENPTFVVYGTFPASTKEYVYLCALPNIDVGSTVIANGSPFKVHRIAAFDSLATKYVTSAAHYETAARRKTITDRLIAIEREEALRDRWKSLAARSPEARRLLKELESL